MSTALLATAQLLFAAGIVAYWAVFYVEGAAAFAGGVDPNAFLAFESAFPVADGCLALALAIAGRWILRRDSRGVPLTLVASGALVFLGLLDAAFNLLNGVYGGEPARAAFNGLLNAACILGGIAMARMAAARIAVGSSRRDEAGAPSDWLEADAGRRFRGSSIGSEGQAPWTRVAERRSPVRAPRTCTRVRRSSGRPRSSPRGAPRTRG